MPYSVGVDPTTHYAVVAFSNAFVGFVVDVNPNSSTTQPTCFVSSQTPPCALESVSMNTGATPQVVMQPNVPVAYVTPEETGVTSVVNLLLTNNTVAIAAVPNGAVLTNGVVTITTPVTNGLNLSSPGSVLIAGVSPADFNGTYNVTERFDVHVHLRLLHNNLGNQYDPEPNRWRRDGYLRQSLLYFRHQRDGIRRRNQSGCAHVRLCRSKRFYGDAPDRIHFHSGPEFFAVPDAGKLQTCLPTPAGAPEVGVRSVAWDPFLNC